MTQSNQSPNGLVFDFEWRLTLATALLVPLLIALGFWQLERAEEKRALASRHEQRMAQPPLSPKEIMALPEVERADRQVAAQVTFSADDYLLIDNRIRGGRVGFEVVAMTRTEDLVLPVNLGWVAGDPGRRELPTVALPTSQQSIEGRVYVPSSVPYALAEESYPPALPSIIQSLALARWAPAIYEQQGLPVFPHEVRISSQSPLARVTEWPIVNQTPAKHMGYAVQWFTMAAALSLAFLFRSTNVWTLIRRR